MSKISNSDRAFYSAAIDFITENLEIMRNFSKLNGISSSSQEDLSDLVIAEVKSWLTSGLGENWLGTLGYKKSSHIPGTTTGIYLCPVCSGVHPRSESVTCERCGRRICHPCTYVVDARYHIEWCNNCISETLINLEPVNR